MLTRTAGPSQGKPQVFFFLPSFPSLVLGLLLALLVSWPVSGQSAEVAAEAPAQATGQIPAEAAGQPGASTDTAVLQSPVDFDDLVRLALRRSPFFNKSHLEIKVRRMDEADSKSDLLPSIFFISRYYPSQPSNPSVTDPQTYYVAFTTGDYNPVMAYLSLKARKVVTEIARQAHLKVMSKGIETLGKSFLELHGMNRLVELQSTYVELARENLRSARERQKLGQVVPMEVEIISQEEAVARAHRAALLATKERIEEGLRKFLDLEPGQPLRLDLTNARRQVLGDFEPAEASLEEAQKRDFDVRIKQLSQELQTWNVALAKMKFMPSFTVVLQTPDPVSSNINRGTFFSLGLNFPIFEGFKRVRNIKRQKMVLQQFESEESVKAHELLQDWRDVEDDLRTAATEMQLAQAQADLARLKMKQAETYYRTGELDFAAFMQARREYVEGQIKVARKSMEYDLAAVELRSLTRDLVYRFVKEERFSS